MSIDASETPVNHVIEDYHVIGVERDAQDRWVGAEVEVNVPSIGHYVVRILTKDAFADERIRRNFEGFEDVTVADFEEDDITEKPPFVFNDALITDEVLELKLKGRTIMPDLAQSLWRIIDQPDPEE